MAAKLPSREETLEIIEKYNPEYREFLKTNAWNYGIHTEMYALYLKEKHEQQQDGGDSE